MSLLLTPEEVAELTGYVQPKRQITWLSANGWKFLIGGDGLPKVARSLYEAQYGAPEKKKRVGVRTEGLARGA